MTYNDFINRVSSLLLYDSIEDDAQHTAFIDQHVRSWMATMQYLVDNFRTRNENTYYENDISVKCKGGIIALPAELRSLTSIHLIRPLKPDCDPITYESDGETVSVDYSNDYNNGIVISGSGDATANGILLPVDDVNGEYSWAKSGYTVTSDGDGIWSLTRTSDSFEVARQESTEKVPTGVWPGTPDAMVVEGAGSDHFNQVYTRDGSNDGKPNYRVDDVPSFGTLYAKWVTGFPSTWGLWDSISRKYSSTQDVSTPDLVDSWNETGGTAPAPTVRRATWADIDAAGIDRDTVPLLSDALTVSAVEFCESDCDDVQQLLPVRWKDRDSVLQGDKCFSYSINPNADTLYVHPFPENRDDRDDQYVRVSWDGVKSDYNGSDAVPFGLDTIDNCAHYINAQLARKKEDKLANYNSYYSSYLEGRKEIALAQRDKSKQTS